MQRQIQETKKVHKYMYEELDPTVYLSVRHRKTDFFKKDIYPVNSESKISKFHDFRFIIFK
jgi:hypothetical protein